jgi:hypothetical protein
MTFSSKLANQSLAFALVVGSSTLGFSVADETFAQSGTAGQGGSTEQGSAVKPSKKEQGVEEGRVDQSKRNERNKGEEHVPPPVRKDKQGVPNKDPDDIQGGPIGPN